MTDALIQGIAIACLALAALGCGYALVATFLVRGFRDGPSPVATTFPPVTVMKPLRGAEPTLRANLESFCDQDYPSAVQWLFGVQDADDPAAAVVRALIASRQGGDLELCITSGTTGSNPKVANLCGMQGRIRHDVVVIADSDIGVTRDYLRRTVAALEQPNVGAVTYLYRGVPHRGLWARLAAMAIDYHFLPDVLVGVALGLATPCFGSTIALRRETLRAIGGFAAFREQLADDYAIGAAVRKLGMRVAIPPVTVEHAFGERTMGQLLRHELRWARTVRVADAAGHAGLVLTYPLPFAMLATALGAHVFGVTAIVASVACRLVLQRQVEHTLGTRTLGIWLGPARDLLSFAIYCASFFVGVVTWRGHRYKVRADGTLLPLGDHKA